MELVPWQERVPEEAYLFNPAFCGALVYEFIKQYQKAKSRSVPFALPFCALSIALHPKTRRSLPNSTLTSLYAWLEDHGDALVGFGDRAQNLAPLVKEALRFAIEASVIIVDTDGDLATGVKRASFTQTVMDLLTSDARECVQASRLLGRWFAKAGSTSTILSGWGLRP